MPFPTLFCNSWAAHSPPPVSKIITLRGGKTTTVSSKRCLRRAHVASSMLIRVMCLGLRFIVFIDSLEITIKPLRSQKRHSVCVTSYCVDERCPLCRVCFWAIRQIIHTRMNSFGPQLPSQRQIKTEPKSAKHQMPPTSRTPSYERQASQCARAGGRAQHTKGAHAHTQNKHCALCIRQLMQMIRLQMSAG